MKKQTISSTQAQHLTSLKFTQLLGLQTVVEVQFQDLLIS